MKLTIIYIYVLAFTFSYCSGKNLPSYIKRCKLADPIPVVSKCITESAQDLLPKLAKGIPELKLPPIEPLRIPKLEVAGLNGSSPGAFSIVFSNIEVYGLKDSEAKEFVFDIEKPYMSLNAYVPHLYVTTDYKMSGKILLFELDSSGKGFMNITDINSMSHHRKMNIVTKKGKRYLNLADDEIEYVKYTKGSLYFNNIFKDNEALTQQVNQAINDNFNEITRELNPVIYEAVRILLLGTIKPLFDEYALNELFE